MRENIYLQEVYVGTDGRFYLHVLLLNFNTSEFDGCIRVKQLKSTFQFVTSSRS